MKMKQSIAASLFALFLALSPATSATEDEPGTIRIQRMTMTTALAIARATIDACAAKGIQIGVTVVDRNGLVQVALRNTLAPQITLPISKSKAYTAANFNAATSALSARANTPVGRFPGFVMVAGGLPVQVGGALLGAVGVSGAPASVIDEECAQAGIDAVIDDLEMGME